MWFLQARDLDANPLDDYFLDSGILLHSPAHSLGQTFLCLSSSLMATSWKTPTSKTSACQPRTQPVPAGVTSTLSLASPSQYQSRAHRPSTCGTWRDEEAQPYIQEAGTGGSCLAEHSHFTSSSGPIITDSILLPHVLPACHRLNVQPRFRWSKLRSFATISITLSPLRLLSINIT